jgi:protein-S-isoprenylcysteine O-methyltransferase Ste14
MFLSNQVVVLAELRSMTEAFGSIILGCWILFILFWVISAFGAKAVAERQSVSAALSHRVPLGFSYVLMADWHLPPLLNLSVTPQADWARALGALVCVLGLWVTLRARWTLGGNWSSDVTFKRGHELVRTGPYRFVRHPIYTGLLIMCLGTAIELGRVRGWLALPLMTAAFWIKLKQEERLLLRHFPHDYPAYQKEVKALVPFAI